MNNSFGLYHFIWWLSYTKLPTNIVKLCLLQIKCDGYMQQHPRFRARVLLIIGDLILILFVGVNINEFDIEV